MKKSLTKKTTEKKCWCFVDGKKIYGVPSGLWGNASGLCGDVSGLCGDVSGLRGNIDECDITDEERKAGVYISDLVS